MTHYFKSPLLQALLYFGCFIVLVLWRSEQPPVRSIPSHDRVVISAPLLTVLYGGDRYLGANVETIRLAATGISAGRADTHYLLRAHTVVSELNPCHENNYYFANALLTWGGAVERGGAILKRASDCRWWDETPAFLYGFNQHFFNKNVPEAQRWLNIAADRADRNAAGYRKFAIMIEAEKIDDEKLALQFLTQERDKAREAKLVKMLDDRVRRLEGLITLRDARVAYEEQTGRELKEPADLIGEGIIDAFPNDPLKMGYEFVDGHFKLKEARIAGMEDR